MSMEVRIVDGDGKAIEVVDGALTIRDEENTREVLSWAYEGTMGGGGGTMLWIRNNLPVWDLEIQSIIMTNAAATLYSVHRPIDGTGVGAAAVVAGPYDLKGSLTPYPLIDVAFDEVVNTIASGPTVELYRVPAGAVVEISKGLIVPYGTQFAIDSSANGVTTFVVKAVLKHATEG